MKVILMMAVTLDGKIAKTSHHFPNWTSSEDKKAFFSGFKKKRGGVNGGQNLFYS